MVFFASTLNNFSPATKYFVFAFKFTRLIARARELFPALFISLTNSLCFLCVFIRCCSRRFSALEWENKIRIVCIIIHFWIISSHHPKGLLNNLWWWINYFFTLLSLQVRSFYTSGRIFSKKRSQTLAAIQKNFIAQDDNEGAGGEARGLREWSINNRKKNKKETFRLNITSAFPIEPHNFNLLISVYIFAVNFYQCFLFSEQQ